MSVQRRRQRAINRRRWIDELWCRWNGHNFWEAESCGTCGEPKK